VPDRSIAEFPGISLRTKPFVAAGVRLIETLDPSAFPVASARVLRSIGTAFQEPFAMSTYRRYSRTFFLCLTMLVPVLAAQDDATRKGQNTTSADSKADAKIKAKAKAKAKGQGAQAKAFQRVIVDLDANGDQVLQRSEVPDSALKEFDALLELMDTDGDKALSRSELQAAGARLQEVLGPNPGAQAKTAAPPAESPLLVDPARRMRMMDTDSDGKISREEWRGAPALFDRADRDADGFLSKDEQEFAVTAMRQFMEAAKKKGQTAKKKAQAKKKPIE